jgi:hypothetical protein
MRPKITNMNIVILHISELSAMVLTGRVSLRTDRIVFLEAKDSIESLLTQTGYIKPSEPEAYLICILMDNLLEESKNKIIEIHTNDLLEIIPLTNDAKRSINPLTERLHLRISSPRWENDWHKYVDQTILEDRDIAARKFANFFNIPFSSDFKWLPYPGTYEFIIKDIGVGQSQLERQMEFSDLGVLEFCIRLANNHDKTWREQDANYVSLKSLRLKYLSSINKKDFSFIDSPEICNALKLFVEESKKSFGYSPFALSAFFEVYRRFLVSKVYDLNAIRLLAVKFIEYKLHDDANDFIHLIGYASGLELIMPLDYSINKDRYSILSLNSPSLPKLEDLHIPPFCGLKSAFELPPATFLEISIKTSDTKEFEGPIPQEENLTLSATLDHSALIQEALPPIQYEKVHPELVQDISDTEVESSSLVSEPVSPPSKSIKSRKSTTQSSLKKVKSKESST